MTTATMTKAEYKDLGLPPEVEKALASGKAKKLGKEVLPRFDLRNKAGAWLRAKFEATQAITIDNKPAIRGIFEFVDSNIEGAVWDREARAEKPVKLNKGERFEMLLSTVLVNCVEKVEAGQTLVIIYKGLVTPENGGNEYHNYEVFAV